MEKLKILIPTDFSVQAEFAYLMAKKLEEKTIVDIHFLHVLDVPDTVTIDEKSNVQTCGEIDIQYITQQKEIAEKQLENLKTIYGKSIHCHVVLGKVTDSIVQFAESHSFDLVVMGTKGAWGMKEKLSGSETQMIARKSKVPLLSLMCDRSELHIQNIVLVHNFNRPVQENLELLHKLISAFHPTIHLLQITSEKVESEKIRIEENMKKFAELNNITSYACHIIDDKDVENGVVHFNQMSNMDIVCIGTHGKGGMFHHSVTEKLINHLFKPIISFQIH